MPNGLIAVATTSLMLAASMAVAQANQPLTGTVSESSHTRFRTPQLRGKAAIHRSNGDYSAEYSRKGWYTRKQALEHP